MKYSVVVAEDEELLLQNLIDKINGSDTGFEVAGSAQTGEQAYELVEKLNPDLVVSDIRMPVMDGISLLKKVHEFYPSTDFIITSGYSDFEYARSAIKYHATEYLLKPIDPDELHDTLMKLRSKYLLAQESYHAVFNKDTAGDSPARIAEILRDYLVINLSGDVNLNMIAYNMNYSSGYLTKIFVAQYDCTPNKFLINLRMQKAQQLLSHDPALSVKQIGDIVGYHDQAYFSRIFKKYCGVSPAEYRGEDDSES